MHAFEFRVLNHEPDSPTLIIVLDNLQGCPVQLLPTTTRTRIASLRLRRAAVSLMRAWVSRFWVYGCCLGVQGFGE